MNTSSKDFYYLESFPDSMDGNVCVLGHSIDKVELYLDAFGYQKVYRLSPKARVDLSVSFLSSEKTRCHLASFVSLAGSNEASNFCSTNRFELFKELALRESDLGGVLSKVFLDIIDREDLLIFALDVAFSVIKDFIKNLKFAVFLHEPHGIHDLAFYFAFEYYKIPIYSYKWLPGTPFSLVLSNIYSDYDDPRSLGEPAKLVEYINFCCDRYMLWKQVVESSSKSGAWPHVEYAAKVFSLAYPLPKSERTVPNLFLPGILKSPSLLRCIDWQNFLSLLGKFNKKLTCINAIFAPKKCLSYLLDHFLDYIRNLFDIVLGAFIRSRYSYSNHCFSPRNSFNRNKKYVYVALHLQPECTSLEFGGTFSNQIRMLKKIRTIVPCDIKLVIKDNFAMASRRHSFARRNDYISLLSKSIYNIEFVSQEYLSKDLIVTSLCVFSVNGTACLEAATLGIPAVIAGLSLYVNHPMISHLSDFSNSDNYLSWLCTKRQEQLLVGKQIDQFYIKRNNKIHVAVPYGKRPSIGDLSTSFASISANFISAYN